MWNCGDSICRLRKPRNQCGLGNYDSVSDGGAWNDTEDENVKEITVFKNDWAAFNNARQANSPVYQRIKEELGCDVVAMNSSGANWQQQLVLLQADQDLPDIFLTEGPGRPIFSASSSITATLSLFPIG